MKGKVCWQERPHKTVLSPKNDIDICQILPDETGVKIAYLDDSDAKAHSVHWRPLEGNAAWQSLSINSGIARLNNLTPYRDYEVYISNDSGAVSTKRLFKPAPVPGTPINYLHPMDDRYAFSGRALGSPSIVRLPSGALLAAMDIFGAPVRRIAAAQETPAQNLTLVFRSDDDGESWNYVCELHPLMWGNLFVHNDRLYIIGCTTEFGDLVIGASDDEGFTWTPPTHLFYGSSTVGCGWQQATMPVARHSGRLWFAIEYAGRGVSDSACVASVGDDADLLDSKNWLVSDPVAWNADWPNAPYGFIRSIAEGNLLVDRDGKLICVMRLNIQMHDPRDNSAIVFRVNTDNPEAQMEFLRYIRLPSGFNSKTHIVYDEISDYYIAVGNICLEPSPMFQRKVIALMVSRDTINWRVAGHILDYRLDDARFTGFQYPSLIIEENALLMQLRTALNGARNFHDANYSTFHKICDFRTLFDIRNS